MEEIEFNLDKKYLDSVCPHIDTKKQGNSLGYGSTEIKTICCTCGKELDRQIKRYK